MVLFIFSMLDNRAALEGSAMLLKKLHDITGRIPIYDVIGRCCLAPQPAPRRAQGSSTPRPFRRSIATTSRPLRSRSAFSASQLSARFSSCGRVGTWRRSRPRPATRRWHPRPRSTAPTRCSCPSRKSSSRGRRRARSPKCGVLYREVRGRTVRIGFGCLRPEGPFPSARAEGPGTAAARIRP